jgi:hypothetical protein
VSSTLRTESTYSPSTWTWVDAKKGKVTDFVMPYVDAPEGRVCVAADLEVSCSTFKDGTFREWSSIEGSDGGEAVYIAEGETPGLCVYAVGVMKCGAGSRTAAGFVFPTAVTAVAVMEKPLSVFQSNKSQLWKIYFVLPGALLSANLWALNCASCQLAQGSNVAPVLQFADSSASAYVGVVGFSGGTDNEDILPLRVRSGARTLRSSVSVRFVTEDGISLTGASIKWTASDLSELLSSGSAVSGITTNSDGRMSGALPTGPVTFTLSGGSMSNGVSLQVALVTVLVDDSREIQVVVPSPPKLVNRKVTVVLPDGAPVPSAVLAVRNTYLTHSYRTDGVRTVVWASRKVDEQGWFARPNCAFCFVPPPQYLAGANGVVNFAGFDPGTRPGSFDFEVSYDDGSLLQKVRHSSAAIEETVKMPFMARVALSVIDAVPTTPEIDLLGSGGGTTRIVVGIKDGEGDGIDGLIAEVEDVCETMNVGGLWSSTKVLTDVCPSGAVLKSELSSRVISTRATAKCPTSSRARTDNAGRAQVELCVSQSRLVRIRAKGVVPSAAICVRVNRLPCVAVRPSSSGDSSGIFSTERRGTRISTKQFTSLFKANPLAGKVSVRVAGGCSVAGSRVVLGRKAGRCVVTVSQASRGKEKGLKKTFLITIS